MSAVTIFKLNENNEKNYSIVDEVATFHFKTEEQQREFIDCLPDMSAIDFIFLLNSSPSTVRN